MQIRNSLLDTRPRLSSFKSGYVMVNPFVASILLQCGMRLQEHIALRMSILDLL